MYEALRITVFNLLLLRELTGLFPINQFQVTELPKNGDAAANFTCLLNLNRVNGNHEF